LLQINKVNKQTTIEIFNKKKKRIPERIWKGWGSNDYMCGLGYNGLSFKKKKKGKRKKKLRKRQWNEEEEEEEALPPLSPRAINK